MEMNLTKLNSIIIMAGAVLLSAISCKDKDETNTAPSLNGKITISVPAYVAQDATMELRQSGVSHPEGKGIGYSWRVTPVMTKNDTTRLENGLDNDGKESDGHFTFTFPDTLKSYTVTCRAFASGYSGLSTSVQVEIVKGGIDGSITGIPFSDSETETIGGKTYHVVKAGGREWLRRNLAEEGLGLPYRNCKAMNDVLGRFYNWNDAMKACPEGWELPSDADWVALAEEAGADAGQDEFTAMNGVAAALMGDAKFNGSRLWEYWPQVGEITDKSGISMIPAGFAILGEPDPDAEKKAEASHLGDHMEFIYPNASFQGVREYAVFWTKDQVPGEPAMAYYRYLISDQPDMLIGKGNVNTFGASVRCVKKK